MKKLSLIAALALLASLFTAAPASAHQQQSPGPQSEGQQDVLRGGFAVQQGRAHSSEYGTPGGAETLVETDPLAFDFEEGDSFSYASAGCEVDVPFNDESLIFRGPGYPGIESPTSARYILEGTVTETSESGERGTVEGTLTIITCENGEEGDQIFVDYQATFNQTSGNDLPLRGTFEITGGTGTFADISGGGTFEGRLTCLPGVLENVGADSCEDLGAYSDAAFNLQGQFADPTVPNS